MDFEQSLENIGEILTDSYIFAEEEDYQWPQREKVLCNVPYNVLDKKI